MSDADSLSLNVNTFQHEPSLLAYKPSFRTAQAREDGDGQLQAGENTPPPQVFHQREQPAGGVEETISGDSAEARPYSSSIARTARRGESRRKTCGVMCAASFSNTSQKLLQRWTTSNCYKMCTVDTHHPPAPGLWPNRSM